MLSPMLITFFVYMIIMLGIGFYAYFATKDFDEYILGGRSLGSFVTALSAGASDMSGWLLMGLPGAVYIFGINQIWIGFGLIIGAYLNWKFIAGRLRVHTEVNNNALTLPDYFAYRFEDSSRILRLMSATIILIFFSVYCASGIVASAKLFEQIFHLSYHKAIFYGAAATILYTFLGGFLASSWTDTIQASLMLFALIVTPFCVLIAIGNFDTAINVIHTQNPSQLDMMHKMSVTTIISLLGWGLGYLGQPHILTRFMAAESKETIKTAMRISMTWMIICLAGAICIGFFGIAYFHYFPHLHMMRAGQEETIFIQLAQVLFNPWIAGIVLSAILASVMSTLSCQLLVASSALTEDLYKSFIRSKASQRELIWFGRLMVLMVSAIAISLAYDPNSEVLKLVSYAWSGFGAAFGPVILISIFWGNMTRNAAIGGMLVGTIVVLFWKHINLFDVYEIVPGFLLSCLAIIVISKLEQKAPASLVERFNKAQAKFNEPA